MNLKTFRERLPFFFVTQHLDPDIQKIIDVDNIRYCRVMSLSVVFLELIMLIVYGFFADPTAKWYWLRIACYASYLLLSAVCFFLFTRMLRRVTNHSLLMTVGLFYCAAAIIWGMIISATDYLQGSQIFVFITNVVCVAGLALIRPLVSIPFFSILFAAFYGVLIFVCGAERSLPTNYIVFLLMVLLINIIRYHTKLSDATTRVEFEKLNQKLQQMSLYDGLTNVKNRHSLTLDAPGFFGNPLFLMIVDIDNFKAMNDLHGHDSGDNLLRRFAAHLQAFFPPESVYRYGGDEFVIAISNPDVEALLMTMESCCNPPKLQQDASSTGVAFSGGYGIRTPKEADEFNEMIRSVDEALYSSKRNGKNQMTRAR
ncbi:MAG: GGDEF domain-containing protein [Christensenella sp.]|nr:GGDEF domain-containing protein [Christensenella sp.]